MPYTAVGAVVEVHYRCSRCGHEGHTSIDGDEFVDNTFGVTGFACEKCGLELDHDDDLDSIDTEYEDEQDDDDDEDEEDE